MIKLLAEPDYRGKILYLSFAEDSSLQTLADVKKLKAQWLAHLASWHSPYKALIDCRNLQFSPVDAAVAQSLDKLQALLAKFFLRKAVAFGLTDTSAVEALPFSHFADQEQAAEELGIRDFSKKRNIPGDLRSQIQFDNHFKEHLIELSFASDVVLKTPKDVQTLKAKLLNNLMLWHSSWKLLVDCSRLQVDASVFSEFNRLEKFLRGFFLKEIVGYSPHSRDSNYPFPVVRSRHKAVLQFEGLSTDEGSLANCASRRQK